MRRRSAILLAMFVFAPFGALSGAFAEVSPPAPVGLSVMPQKSHGACPRQITARAAVVAGAAEEGLVRLSYRFLENGSPVGNWRVAEVPGGSTIYLRHDIMVTADRRPQRTPLAVADPAPGRVALGDPKGVIARPTVGVQVVINEQTHGDTAIYQATCAQGAYAGLRPAPGQPLPDLTVSVGLRLGQTLVPWGGTATLTARDVVAIGPTGCLIFLRYDVVNRGEGPAGSHTNRLSRGAVTLASRVTPPLRPERKRQVSGMIRLPTGQSVVRLHLDGAGLIPEANEGNNMRAVRVMLNAPCSPAARPLGRR
ncbi:MAG: hypothetical protein AAGK00_15200 [Pseudomonadota bacterium]